MLAAIGKMALPELEAKKVVKMAIKNYTSKKSAVATAAEIEDLLIKHGAKMIQKDITNGNISAFRFVVDTAVGLIPIQLPVNVEAVYKILQKDRKTNRAVKVTMEQAERTAWRCLYDWTAAQMALIEIGMVKLEQVFLPYVVYKDGRTLYEAAAAKGFYLKEGQNNGTDDGNNRIS